MEKTIVGFPNYTVDENGIVRSKRGKILAQQIQAKYKRVRLWKGGNGKTICVHRLVAEAFIPNPNNLPCVNHKDENKFNNSVSNLEWCTVQYNNLYGKNAPIKRMVEARSKGVAMCDHNGKILKTFASLQEAQRQTGIWQSNISKCCAKERPMTGGYVWKFITE